MLCRERLGYDAAWGEVQSLEKMLRQDKNPEDVEDCGGWREMQKLHRYAKVREDWSNWRGMRRLGRNMKAREEC